MLDQLLIHRQILYDLTVHYLEPLPGHHGRLAFLASLRDPATGLYVQGRLAAVYGKERVNESLAHCHEEIFERLLELPLAQQEEDLRSFLTSLSLNRSDQVQYCLTHVQDWIPPQAPGYLKELFLSNQTALRALLQERKSKVRSSK
jgi:hypothetical protein